MVGTLHEQHPEQEAVRKGAGNDGGKRCFSRSHLLRELGECCFEMDILISVYSLEVYTDLVFLIRGHFCTCPCGMSRMDHLDGKWVGQTAKLSSPEKSLTDPSVGRMLCTPVVARWFLQSSILERKAEEFQACHLSLMAMPFSDRRHCPCSGNQ